VDYSAESSPPEFVGNTPVRDLDPPAITTIETPSARYVAGVHYERLPVPAPTSAADGQIEVCEFFMFGCVHCYDFEPILTSWVDAHSEVVDFVRVPALFNEVAVLHAQAFYTAEALGAADEFVGPFYTAIHERGLSMSSVTDIRDFFVAHGIDAARFDATFDSDAVRGDLRRAAELNRLYRVDATPTIGVAGKYRTNASMAGSNEAMFEVVDALVDAESAGQACEERDYECKARKALEEARDLRDRELSQDDGAIFQ
jgi:thiol:disulfide interchange protein DsbA